MNRNKFEEFRKAITVEYEDKILKLKEEMNQALSLLDKIERSLCVGNIDKQTSLPIMSEYQQSDRTKVVSMKSIPERMNDALNKLDGIFSRQKLFQEILADGNPSVSEKSLAPVFTKFLKDGKITTESAKRGKRAGTYRKATKINLNILNETSGEIDDFLR